MILIIAYCNCPGQFCSDIEAGVSIRIWSSLLFGWKFYSTPVYAMATALKNKNPLSMPALYSGLFKRQHRILPGQKLLKSYQSIRIVQLPGLLKDHFASMGLVMPFHPCLWDPETTRAALKHILQMVATKMKHRYTSDCIYQTIARLEALFLELNYDTLHLSIAIVLTPAEAKVRYLHFPVRQVVFFGKKISFLDLAVNIKRCTNFYLVALTKTGSILFEHSSNRFIKVREKRNTRVKDIYQDLAVVLGLLNDGDDKPIFVTGIAGRAEHFCGLYSNEICFPVNYKIKPALLRGIPELADEIAKGWKYWHLKFFMGKLTLALRANLAVWNFDSVLKALQESKDGILLLDKRLKSLLQKRISGLLFFDEVPEFLYQIERFLMRGNRIETLETGMLETWGGIVLLKEDRSISTVPKPYQIKSWHGSIIY